MIFTNLNEIASEESSLYILKTMVLEKQSEELFRRKFFILLNKNFKDLGMKVSNFVFKEEKICFTVSNILLGKEAYVETGIVKNGNYLDFTVYYNEEIFNVNYHTLIVFLNLKLNKIAQVYTVYLDDEKVVVKSDESFINDDDIVLKATEIIKSKGIVNKFSFNKQNSFKDIYEYIEYLDRVKKINGLYFNNIIVKKDNAYV